MYLNTRMTSLNQFLSSVYGVPITLSLLLTELGFTEQQLDQLHRDHWEEIVASSIALLKDRLVPWSDNHRSYDVVCRRFGLDGRPTETLQAIGERLGLTRERVRQLEQRAILWCRSNASRTGWEAGLHDVATRLAGVGQSHEAVIPLPLFVKQDLKKSVKPKTRGVLSTTATNIDLRPEYVQLVTQILRRVSGGIRPSMVGHILYGSNGSVVDPLVSAYEFPEYGIFHSHGYRNVMLMVLDICDTESDFMDLEGWVGTIS